MSNSDYNESMQMLANLGRSIAEATSQWEKMISEVTKAAAQTVHVHKDALQQMLRISGQIASSFSNICIPRIPEKVIARFQYINLLKEIKWPLFLIYDEEFEKDITKACSDRNKSTSILEVVIQYCNENYFRNMLSAWIDSTAINPDRIPVLQEALLMHNNRYYYSSTSILMCQIYGIAADIVDLADRNGLVADKDDKELVSQHYNIDYDKIDREKGRLMQTILFTENGVILWDAMASYLKDEILCSSDSAERWRCQPLRNKICHGVQLNYGTIEHSLKAILSIDMLIQLANEIEYIAKNKRNLEPMQLEETGRG